MLAKSGLFTSEKGSGGVLDLGEDDEEQLVGISSASREVLLMPHEGHYCCLGRGTTVAY